MVDRFEKVEREFPSLEACVSYVESQFTEDKFLFRGERTDRFLTTPSMLERVRADQMLPCKCRAAIEKCVLRLHKALQEFLGLPPGLAMGFLQHYEAPTRLLDLTSSPAVAAYFAAQGDVGSDALFAIIPRNQPSDLVEIQDLTQHPKANRPRMQSAFTFFSERHNNLKSDECISELGARWYRFTLQQSDKVLYYDGNDHFLNARADEVAGVIQILMDSCGKINDWAAQWLADHVVAAPFITKFVERDDEGRLVVELVSAEQAGFEYDITIERFNNYRIWSDRFKDRRGHGGLENLWRV